MFYYHPFAGQISGKEIAPVYHKEQYNCKNHVCRNMDVHKFLYGLHCLSHQDSRKNTGDSKRGRKENSRLDKQGADYLFLFRPQLLEQAITINVIGCFRKLLQSQQCSADQQKYQADITAEERNQSI